MNICPVCGGKFEPPPRNRKRLTCSRRCAAFRSWQINPNRSAAISAGQKRNSAAISERNRRRWAQPSERAKLSERNRQRWQDPVIRQQTIERQRAAQTRPERRQFYSAMRKALWEDPEYRARVTAAIRAGHQSQQYRAMFSALLRERWQDPVWREKWLAAMRRRYGHEIAAPIPRPPDALPVADSAPEPVAATPPPTTDHRSLARRAEEDAIAAFLAEKGFIKLPDVGDPELGKLPPLQWDRQKRKFTRPKSI